MEKLITENNLTSVSSINFWGNRKLTLTACVDADVWQETKLNEINNTLKIPTNLTNAMFNTFQKEKKKFLKCKNVE